MSGIRYVHAADLRLDAPFSGISLENASPELTRLLQEATFIALERLVRLCENQRPDFLVLSGAVHDRNDAGTRARLKLREACERLHALDIPVYIARSDRDPRPARFQSLNFPDNVHIFPAEKATTFEFCARDGRRALIHGMSEGLNPESGNFESLFRRKPDDQAFQLAVLNGPIQNGAKNDACSPPDLSVLKNAGMDAWALSHAHDSAVLCDRPFIACPGASQGLSITEGGKHGCLVIHAREKGKGWHCSSEFHSLAPVIWQTLHLDIDQLEDKAGLEERLDMLIREELENAPPALSAILASLSISGDMALDSWLREDGRLEKLRATISANYAGSIIFTLNGMALETSDEAASREAMARDDLLGETMRVYADLAGNPANFSEAWDQAMAPLMKRRLLADIIQDVNEADRLSLLYQAEKLCMDILENR